VPNQDAAAIERATRMLISGKIPKPLARMADGLYDRRLRAAMLVPNPAWPVRAALHVGLKTCAALLRHLARPRTEPLFADGIVRTTYPDGYQSGDLGP
jgi:hypothetical protein